MRIVEIQYLGLHSRAGNQKVGVLPQEQVRLCADYARLSDINSDEVSLQIRPSNRYQNILHLNLTHRGEGRTSLSLATINMDEFQKRAKCAATRYAYEFDIVKSMISAAPALKKVWCHNSNDQQGLRTNAVMNRDKVAATFEADYFTASLGNSLSGIIDGSDDFWDRLSEEIRALYIRQNVVYQGLSQYTH